jgi:hypothetical protein
VRGGRRRGERGVESLEFLAAIPLLGLIIVLAWQGIVVAREHTEAEADARAIARVTVLCPKVVSPPPLSTIDSAAPDTALAWRRDESTSQVIVVVTLPPRPVISGMDLSAWGLAPVSAKVTMHQEPCP